MLNITAKNNHLKGINIKSQINFNANEHFNLFKYDDLVCQISSEAKGSNVCIIIDQLYKKVKNNEALDVSDCLQCLSTHNHNNEINFTRKVNLEKNTLVLLGINNNSKAINSEGKEIITPEAYIKIVDTTLPNSDHSNIYITKHYMTRKYLGVYGEEIPVYNNYNYKLLKIAQAICNKTNFY